MITIITGTPGAGKTLHAIEKLLVPLVGQTITYTDKNGEAVTAPRTIYTNINGLLLEHELIGPGGDWRTVEKDKVRQWDFDGDGQGLRDWHQWAKPGSVIVYDEFQRVWPPRPNGAPVPPDMSMLDTHRHMGVDFILITQNVMNTDRHLHALAGRHLHVRRIANMKMAVVYEWDHVSRSLLYSKAITKSPWRYSPKVFKLYQSAEVHTKQPRRIPGLVWFILMGIIAGIILGPTVWVRLQERIHPKPVEVHAPKKLPGEAQAPAQGVAPSSAPLEAPGTPSAPSGLSVAVAAPGGLPGAPGRPAPAFAGCMAARGVCKCYDSAGASVQKEAGFCEAQTRPGDVQLGFERKTAFVAGTPARDSEAQLEMLANVAERRQLEQPRQYRSLIDVAQAFQ